jgi:hypothetical protein
MAVCSLVPTSNGWTWECPQLNMNWCKINLISKVDRTDITSSNSTCGTSGTVNCETQMVAKYGSVANWMLQMSTRMNNLGFTGAGQYSYDYIAQWQTGMLPYEYIQDFGFDAIRDTGTSLGEPYHVKDAGWIPFPSGMKCGNNADPNLTTPDPYDPEFATAFGTMYADSVSPTSLQRLIYFNADDGDNLGVMNTCCTPNAHVDFGLVFAADFPMQVHSSTTANTIGSPSVTQVAVSGGNAVYSLSGGGMSACASNGCVGLTFTYSGFTNAGNNVAIEATASTNTSMTGVATTQVNETHSASVNVHYFFSNTTLFVKQGLRDWLLNQYGCTGAGTPAACCTGAGTGTCSADPSSGSYIGSGNAATALSALNTAWAMSSSPCPTCYTTWNTSDSGGLAGIANGTYQSWGGNAACQASGVPYSCCTGSGTGSCTQGTGFLDENGNNLVSGSFSCGGLNGNGPQQNQSWGRIAQIQTDLDHFVAYGFAAKWATQVWSAWSAACGSNCPPLAIPIYDGPYFPASSSVYAGMAQALAGNNFLFEIEGDGGPSASTSIQTIINNNGNTPVVVLNYSRANPDSFVNTACDSTTACFSTQAARGTYWATTINQDSLRLTNPAGKYAIVGFEHWALYDSESQHDNFGLFTPNDNPYDGSAASTATSSGSCLTGHSYTSPAICQDSNGNFQSLAVSSCTSAASGTVWNTNYNGLTVDNTCEWFNQGNYARVAETATWGNALLPVYNFNTSSLCDPSGPSSSSMVMAGHALVHGNAKFF